MDNNAPPIITSQAAADLGVKTDGFTVSYVVSDEDNDVVTVSEKLDGVVKRTYTATLGANNSFAVTGSYFQKILNGAHTLTVTAMDAGGKSTTKAFNFEKQVYNCSITLATPLPADDKITRTILNIVGNIPTTAHLLIEVTNNANDPSPVWEDATGTVMSGYNYLFKNETAANGFAFNFRVTVDREGSSGGYINSIGGAFE